MDIRDDDAVFAAVAQAVERFGHIDVLINNAGYGLFGPFETATQEVIERQFQTNVFGVFAVTRAVLPHMRERAGGVIINVASLTGLVAMPLYSLYAASKFAVVGFSESLSHELAPLGIRVKVFAPGAVATDFSGRSLARTFEGDGGPYADSIRKVMAVFAANRGTSNASTAEQLAQALYDAATDGSDAPALWVEYLKPAPSSVCDKRLIDRECCGQSLKTAKQTRFSQAPTTPARRSAARS